MNLSITNISIDKWPVASAGITILAGETRVIDRTLDEVLSMRELHRDIAAGIFVIELTPTPDELASEILTSAFREFPVLATDLLSGDITVRKSFAAGITAGPDDVVIYAVGALPALLGPKYRVIDAYAVILTPVGGSSLTVKDAPAGVQLAVVSSAAADIARATALGAAAASVQVTLGPTKGLIFTRSNDNVAGELYITLRKEA